MVSQRNKLSARLKEAEEKLSSFYKIVEIDKRFCNLISMGYMNEFIHLGVSSKLDGTDGLYYLIMKELRMDQIQSTLDDISNKLDYLIDQQHGIYSELLEVNKKCDTMIDSVVRAADSVSNSNKKITEIANSTEIAAYNSERLSRELEYQNYLMLVHNC